MSRQEVLAKAQQAVLLGGHAHITGMWAWVKFEEKPSDSAREQLKSEGFRWSKTKKMWYFAGKPSAGKQSMPWSYITSKYGDEEL